jgi:hypothetical protein
MHSKMWTHKRVDNSSPVRGGGGNRTNQTESLACHINTVKSGEFHDETHWTITLQQPTAVQVEAASGVVAKGTHLCPAKVTVPAQGL